VLERLKDRRPSPERAKRRLRAIKRETGGGKGPELGPPLRAPQGQRKAIRGTRLRQRRT
jgi:hypothetical protein